MGKIVIETTNGLRPATESTALHPLRTNSSRQLNSQQIEIILKKKITHTECMRCKRLSTVEDYKSIKSAKSSHVYVVEESIKISSTVTEYHTGFET